MNTQEKPDKSKSQVKRELLALQTLGRELVNLSGKELERLPLPDTLRDAVLAARPMKKGALKRQIQHIGALMRGEDAEAIRQALAVLRQPHQDDVQAFHEIEGWRDALLAGDTGLMEDLCSRFPDIDRQHVSQLVRNAGKEQAANKPPKSARALFHYLQGLQDK